MYSSFHSRFGAAAAMMLLAISPSVFSQTPQKLIPRIDLPVDSPVALLSADWGDTSSTPRGGAFSVDVRAALSFRNATQRRIRGVTLAVLSQEVTPGGKGSVSVPSLDVAPGETFPINIDLHLLRPIGGLGGQAGSPGVAVRLDGVLFDDLNFYGPDNLHSRRSMTLWELEARRDRQYFKKLLEASGGKGLQDAMIASLARQAESDPPRGGVQIVRGRATNSDAAREVSFAFLHFPNAPVEASNGMARIAGNEAHAPRIEVRNRSDRAIRYLEIGWIVKDQDGREFLAASMPADVNLAAGQSGQVGEDASMKFLHTSIQGMTGFVSSVGFTDGSYWIPDRGELNDLKLRRVVSPSPEEQRLAELYRKRGLNVLIEELKKF
jgi:hypothetical protein